MEQPSPNNKKTQLVEYANLVEQNLVQLIRQLPHQQQKYATAHAKICFRQIKAGLQLLEE